MKRKWLWIVLLMGYAAAFLYQSLCEKAKYKQTKKY